MYRARWFLLILAVGLLAVGIASTTPPPAPDLARAAEEGLLQYTLSGRVYDGDCGVELPDYANAIANVTVTLYGSNNETQQGDLLATTTTNSTGWYGLDVPDRPTYDFYNIVETDPSGYTSVCATSVSGAVKNNNWIQYRFADLSGTTTGNKFWDRPRVAFTPTTTRTPTPTVTWTAISRVTPTWTATSRVTPTWTATIRVTPTWTATSRVTPTWTATSRVTPTWTATSRVTPTWTATSRVTPTPTATGTLPCQPNVQVDKRLVSHPSGVALVGETLTYIITITNASDDDVLAFVLVDHSPADYLEFLSASPVPDKIVTVNIAGVLTTYVGWLSGGALPPHGLQTFALQLRAKAPTGQTPAINVAEATMQYSCGLFGTSDRAPVVIVQPEQPLRLTKRLLDPPGGSAHVGDLVRFSIVVENLNPTDAMVDVEDTFAEAEFDFVASTPPPTLNVSNGMTRMLRWENVVVPAGGSRTIILDLRPKLAGITARNCARWVTRSSPGVAGLLGPLSCAEVRVLAREERDFAINKQFYVPSNHIAFVGDKVNWRTGMINTGNMPIVAWLLHDYITPGCVVPDDYWLDSATLGLGPYPPGASHLALFVNFPAAAVCSPAINTAKWTVQFADGITMTKSARDYVYILDRPEGDGLRIHKERILPTHGVVISDTVVFRITVVNVLGAPLQVVPLHDEFEIACLSFQGAVPPPDHIIPAGPKTILEWNNIGPLGPGQSRTVEVAFHARAACLDTLNCVRVHDERTQGVSADCVPVTIEGRRPELLLSKRLVTVNPVPLGSIAEYLITVRNIGNAPAPLVPLHDTFNPLYWEFVGASLPPTHVDNASGDIIWDNVGPLAPQAGVQILIRLLAEKPGAMLRNCAVARYEVGSAVLTAEDCAFADIIARGAAIGIEKRRIAPPPHLPAVAGDVVAFEIIVRNVGDVPLFNLLIRDSFDPGCLGIVPGQPGLILPPVPGQAIWEFLELPVGGVLRWEVLFLAIAPCGETINCIEVHAVGPEGGHVEDRFCVPVFIAPPEPGVRIWKTMRAPQAMPVLGDILRFEIVVQNSGNTTLVHVPLTDNYNPGCLEFVSAQPAPDSVNVATGQLSWFNLGPLPPGDARVITLYMRAIGVCFPAANCVHVMARDVNGQVVESRDCAEVHIAAGRHYIYLPLLEKQFRRQ